MTSRLGPYEVGAKIGGGGMATVYVGRKGAEVVAIKVIRDELAKDREYIHMFLDEAKILSRLWHPDIIVTHDFGVSDDAARFIAMELLLGRSLIDTFEKARETEQRMPVDLAAHVAMHVAEALAYAHALKSEEGTPLHVVHRDVNPTNIFLTYDGRVKLIDFGLAKSAGRLSKSGEGIVKGKVPYLSPEQVDEKPFDHRADLYALGATLWELTTGRRLFKRATDIETIRAIKAQDIPDARTVAPGLYPDALWTIVERALARDPNARYATGTAMAADLAAFIDKHGRKGDMQERLAAWIEELFPGERAKQETWLAEVSAVRVPAAHTMAPPAPVAEVPAPQSKPEPPTPTQTQTQTPTPTQTQTPTPAPTPTPDAPLELRAARHPGAAIIALALTIGFLAALSWIFQRC